ncbi:AAC(3) family N-acetyltransferase [Streptomyces griseoaurantiacus]|uniref:AAC(3) family N-acetyltransferase n=1 Tax=Streptomyces griseoaurantiacus TaxID=68213 RepID=UPI003F195423
MSVRGTGTGATRAPGSAPGRHVVGREDFLALARARGGARRIALLRAGQLSKRMLLVRALREAAGERVEEAYRGLVALNREDPDAWREVMLQPYLDEGAARTLVALERGEDVDTSWFDRLVRAPYTPEGAPWPRVRTVCEGRVLDVRLADRGPFRDAHGHPLAPPLTGPERERWARTLEEAWRVLVRRHPWHAEAVAACLTTLVPLEPGPDGGGVSSAARRAHGAVAASLPEDPVLLALGLVHEFLHVQLGALLDLVPLHGPPTAARHHAPWRPDPRPAGALLQGTYAHLGVTDFWRAELVAGTGGPRARREYETWHGHTDAAAGTLLGSGELTPAGERFVTELRRAVRRPHPGAPARTAPLTRGRLAAELRALGLGAGDTVLVHSSLRALGPVEGGAETVVDAFLDVLGPAGTLVVYTQTPDNSDPSRWPGTRGYAVPEEQWDRLRERLPAFDPDTTPAFGVGVLPETVRARPGALRSTHPQSSFTALGARARELTAHHAPDCHLGERSPLARLEEAGARVLLLGVGWEVCTAFHLAEYRLPGRPRQTYSCVVGDGAGGRAWYTYTDVRLDSSPFARIGAAYEADAVREGSGDLVRGRVGAADCRLFGLGPAVAHAAVWLADRGAGVP